ncbi:LptF/LptG family permease, partial [Acinetobacter baumannii]
PVSTEVGNDKDALNLKELLTIIKTSRSGSEAEHYAAAELEWRISLALCCLLLSLLAIQLGEVPPRHSRFARLLPGI